MQLTLVRHGVTRWNALRRFQGSTDVPLTDEGLAQAGALASRLAGERPDRIYSSRLQRALQTAAIIAKPHRLSVIADDRLREFAFGTWEGLTWPEIVAKDPAAAAIGWRDATRYAPEGGERFEAVCRRIAAFYADLVRTGAEHAIVVTHAGVLHATLRVLNLSNAPQAAGANFLPAGITRIAIDGERSELAMLNDVEHLA